MLFLRKDIIFVACSYVFWSERQSSILYADMLLYERVFSVAASVPEEEMLVLGGDFNGHVGEHSVGFEGVHGGSGHGMRNQDGMRISSKECITQHKLLVCDLVISAKPVKPIRIPPRRKPWKFNDTVVQKEFEQAVSMKCQQIPAEVDNAWEYIKNGLLEAADEIFGWTRGGCPRHKEIWWWNNEVDNAVKEKRKTWQQ